MLMSLLPINASAAKEHKLIAVTFDDGPGKCADMLLDGLSERDVKCTFFLVGKNVASYSSQVRRMWEEGHEVASHTYDHARLGALSRSDVADEVLKADDALDKAIGLDLNYNLRPPYGDVNDNALSAVGTPCFYWTVDTCDWKTLNADSVYNEIINKAKDGSVILLHELYESSVKGALRAIDTLQEQGYEFVTISELFYRRGISLTNGEMYYDAYPTSAGTADAIKDPEISLKNAGGDKKVSISGDSRGTVFYTTDGTVPAPGKSIKYTGPFVLDKNCTVKAISILNWNGLRSDVVTKDVELPTAEAPVLSHKGTKLKAACETEDAKIYYTTDGTDPTEESSRIKHWVTMEKGFDYRIRAIAPELEPSPVSRLTYSARGNFFEDVSVYDWCYDAVDRAVSEEIFRNYTDTRFDPDRRISRAELVSILYRMAGSPHVIFKKEPFSDVDKEYWAYKAIVWAYKNDIIEGYADGRFAPAGDVSRQALCAIMARYLEYKDDELQTDENVLSDFGDSKNVAEELTEDVNKMCALGVIHGYGDGTLHPENCASRAQTATMLLRLEDILSSQS